MHVSIRFGKRNSFIFRITLLALSWLLGITAGVLVLGKTSHCSLMYSTSFTGVSIVGLFISLIPLLLSYISLKIFYFILPIAFTKAFLFTYSFGLIYIAFGDAGWLMAPMILFWDIFLVFSLLILWFGVAQGIYPTISCFIKSSVALLTIGCITIWVVSPFVERLLN